MTVPFNMGTPEDLDLELAQQAHDRRLGEWLDRKEREEAEQAAMESRQPPTAIEPQGNP